MVARALKKELPFMLGDKRRYDLDEYDKQEQGIILLYDQLIKDYTEDLDKITDKNNVQYVLGQAVIAQAKLLADHERESIKKRGTYDRDVFIKLNEVIYRSRLLQEDPANQVNLAQMAQLANRLPGKRSPSWKLLATLLLTSVTITSAICLSIALAPLTGGLSAGAMFLWIASQIGPQAVAFLWMLSTAITNTLAAGAAGASSVFGATISPTAFAGVVGASATGVSLMNSFKWKLKEDRGLSKAVADLSQKVGVEPAKVPDGANDDGEQEGLNLPAAPPAPGNK